MYLRNSKYAAYVFRIILKVRSSFVGSVYVKCSSDVTGNKTDELILSEMIGVCYRII